jgi:hypothetical protein
MRHMLKAQRTGSRRRKRAAGRVSGQRSRAKVCRLQQPAAQPFEMSVLPPSISTKPSENGAL